MKKERKTKDTLMEWKSICIGGGLAAALVLGSSYISRNGIGGMRVIRLIETAEISYDGPNGFAKIRVKPSEQARSQKEKAFFSSLKYSSSQTENLRNDDAVVLTAKYDKKAAEKAGILIRDASEKIRVSGLKRDVSNASDFTPGMIAALRKNAKKFLADDDDSPLSYDSLWYAKEADGESDVVCAIFRRHYEATMISAAKDAYDEAAITDYSIGWEDQFDSSEYLNETGNYPSSSAEVHKIMKKNGFEQAG